MPSVHPRCSQHSLVAPDGMCVLCRKQASSGPPRPQHEPELPAQPQAADAVAISADKCAALLVGVALVTMVATYVLDTSKAKEIATSQDQSQRSEIQHEDAESARLQELVLATAQAEDQAANGAAMPEQAAAERDSELDQDEE